MGFKIQEITPGVYDVSGRLATKNMVPGTRVYSEELLQFDGSEYRLWDAGRSKTGAAIKKGLEIAQKGDIILCAGKGHEDYQEIKGVKHHFNDLEEFKKLYAGL